MCGSKASRALRNSTHSVRAGPINSHSLKEMRLLGREMRHRGTIGRGRLERLHAKQLAHLGADDVAAASRQRAANDFVLEIQMEVAAARDELHEIRKVLSKHQAGM